MTLQKFAALTLVVMVSFTFGTRTQSQEPAKSNTKATLSITGLHCPPCTNTVQSSLTKVKGVKSATVDWNKKNATVEFDESVLSLQALAAAIEKTPHMMGGDMKYAGWLALNVPSVTDEPSGKKVKDILGKIEGVKSVATYPKQHSASVLLSGKGTTSSKQILDALMKEGIKATLL